MSLLRPESAGLAGLDIYPEYRRGHADLVADFYLPCLRESVVYDRAAGYFTSTSLALVAAGLTAFLEHSGAMRLIASPILDAHDIEALKRGVGARNDVVQRALLSAFEGAPEDEIIRNRLGFLAWLIAEGRLEVCIATTENEDGIYHEKFGVFGDKTGNYIAFTGSPNETRGGLAANYESIDVYKSWTDEAARVEMKRRAFDALWHDSMPGVRTVSLPTAVRDRILRYRQPTKPERDPLERGTFEGHRSAETSAPYLRKYQRDAVDSWFAAGCRGVLSMATGTGKTRTALRAVEQLKGEESGLFVAVVAPYVHLVDQWTDEIAAAGLGRAISCHGSSAVWTEKLARALSDLRLGIRKDVICVVTQAGLIGDAFERSVQGVFHSRWKTLIIGDEVHGLGSPSATTRLAGLPFGARMGLSATPQRWKDEETQALLGYFGDVVFEYGLREAIDDGYLVPYDYHPHFIELSEHEFAKYTDVTRRLARLLAQSGGHHPNDLDEGPIGALLRQRSAILNGADARMPSLQNEFSRHQGHYTLVYTTPELIDETVLTVSGAGFITHRFTFRESAADRRKLLRSFADGHMDVLVAIRCLDQGVDIPRTETAYILASSSNSREFIQRRGRILRRAEGKVRATIHDFITLPPTMSGGDPDTWKAERALVRREILRFREFAMTAENRFGAEAMILTLQDRYRLYDL